MTHSPNEPNQKINIAGDASLEQVQVGGIAGRDQIQVQGEGHTVTIHNNPGKRPGSGEGLTRQEYRNRQVLLRKVKEFWVEGVLQKSLHEQILIALGMDDRPNAVTSILNRELLQDDDRPISLENTSVISVFDQIGSGRSLLVLGEPGSGKTITLLQLARDLVDRAKQDADYLIPVVLNLSSWANQPQSIAAWVVEELNSQYQVPRKVGQQWIDQQQLLLLLDGLDEVAANRRNDCIVALNAFQQEQHTEMVVCCRIKDYEALSDRLQLDKAICLRSLTLDQGLAYLDRLSTDLISLKQLLTEDSGLQELAQTPLMLNLMVLAYQEIALDELPQAETRSQRQQQLFDRYIDRMFERSRKHAYAERLTKPNLLYSRQQTIHWLIWLAQRMVEERKTVFLIEKIQPTWLKGRVEIIEYRFRNEFIIGLIVGAIVGLIGGLIASFIGIIEGITIGFSCVLIVTITNLSRWIGRELTSGNQLGRIVVTEKWHWKWNPSRERILTSVGLGFFFSIVISEGYAGVVDWLMYTLLLMFIFLLFFELHHGLRVIELRTRTVPNQGIWNSLKNFVVIWLVGTLSLALILGLFVKLFAENSFVSLFTGTFYGLTFGLSLGLAFGGAACIQHFNLRSILYRKGRIPWNYARFLDHAAEQLFLQKVGGGYIFIHRMLMEHFAQLEIKN